MNDSFVRADVLWHRNVKNIYVDCYDLNERGVDLTPEKMPESVAELLRRAGAVPEDAYLIGYFYEVHRNGFTVRMAHRSFQEVPYSEMIPTEDFPRSSERRPS